MTMTLIITIAVLLIALFLFKVIKNMLHSFSVKKRVPDKRIYYIEKVVAVVLAVTTLLVISVIWSVDFRGLSVVLSSVFAVLGVALFAQWSILSNVTASIIIFFTFPATVGDRIRIVDGEDSIEGEIIEISLFQVELIDSMGNTVLYPNNQLLQKPVVKMAKEKTDSEPEALL